MDAISALSNSGAPRSEWPAEVRDKAGKERLNSDGRLAVEGSREEVRKEVLKGLDPSLRAFLEYVSSLPSVFLNPSFFSFRPGPSSYGTRKACDHRAALIIRVCLRPHCLLWTGFSFAVTGWKPS